MSRRNRLGVIAPCAVAFALAAVAGACGRPEPARSRQVEDAGPIVALGIDKAENGGASIAALGSRVVMVWASTKANRTNIQSAVSEDGGLTFGAPVRVNDIDGDARVNGEQPPRVAIGPDIVVAWQSRRTGVSEVRLARSKDGGRTFGAAQTIHDAHLTGARGWSSLAIDGTGRVHSAWLDGRNSRPTATGSTKPPQAQHQHAEPIQDIYYALIAPNGSRTETRVASDVCFCCKTGVAVGEDGATYVAWRNVYPPNVRDMAVARSDDGRTFTAPVRVSEDGWKIDACPEDGPSIAVDASNVLHIAWPTIVDVEASRKGIFYSYSTDRGRTFAPRIRLDDAAGAGHAGHPQINLAGASVAVTWDESETGGSKIRARVISSRGRGQDWSAEPGATLTVVADAPVTHPAVAATDTALLVSWTETTGTGSDIRVRRLVVNR